MNVPDMYLGKSHEITLAHSTPSGSDMRLLELLLASALLSVDG